MGCFYCGGEEDVHYTPDNGGVHAMKMQPGHYGGHNRPEVPKPPQTVKPQPNEVPAIRADELKEVNTFNSFVAEFDTEKFISGVGDSKARKEDALEAEIEKLKEQLKQTNSEKAEITSKFEKLSAICRSQRHEIQELKQALASSTQNKESVKNEISPMLQSSSTSLKEEEEGQTRFLDQQGEKPDWNASNNKEQKQWQAFAEEPKSDPPLFGDKSVKSVRTRNGQQKKDQVNSGFESWGFGSDSFTAIPASNFHMSKPMNEGNSSQRFGEAKIVENKTASQPAGWAGF